MTEAFTATHDRQIETIRVGRRMARTRRSAQLTQRQLGEHIGVSHQTIARYESGETAIPALTLMRIALVLKARLDIFFED